MATRVRRTVQGVFLGLTLIGVFWLGANCERWCPFGGVEAIHTYVTEGNMVCSLGVSNFFMLAGVLSATLLVRRAFCGYMCPIGAICEYMGVVGRWLHVPKVRIPGGVDRLLSLLKYVLLVVVLFLTYRAGELIFRSVGPCYALIGRHGEDITYWAYVVGAAILVASLFMSLPFCRWFCPLAAVMNVFSRVGWTRIHRDVEGCRDCGLCTQQCPMAIPVDKLKRVTASRCIACLQCVEACPASAARGKALHWGPTKPRGRRWAQPALIVILLCCTMGAVTASYLVPLPSYVKQRGEPPVKTAVAELKVQNLTCRGRANLFAYFLERQDIDAVDGYLRIAAWPGPGWARVRITYDPSRTDESAIKQAITNPVFEPENNYVRSSPFQIEGYDPLSLDF